MEIGFIDYSHNERNKILSTLKLLGERNTLDELGVGTIRDAYADILFPGISTLQTRAKYFVLVPYLFYAAMSQTENGKIRSSQEFRAWIGDAENRIAAALTKNCPNETGIIGINAYRQNRSVKIKPSMIYWNGLKALGILRSDNASIDSACKLLYSVARRKAETEMILDGDSFDDPTARNQNGALFLPIQPDDDFIQSIRMALTGKEAEFLRDCILRSVPKSLLAFFVKRRMVSESFLSVPDELLEPDLRRDYNYARGFSRFIYGAHIRYNVIYSDYTDQAMIERYEQWRDAYLSSPIDLEKVLARIPCGPDVANFCRGFRQFVMSGDLKALDRLIVRREISAKGERAKLRKPKEYRYDPDNPIHLYQFDYRFGTAKAIITDILNGLEGSPDV